MKRYLLLAIGVLAVLVLVALVVHPGRHAELPAPVRLAGARARVPGTSVAGAYVAGGALYVTVDTSRPGAVNVRSELLRVDPASLRASAGLRLGSMFDDALLAHGVLWVVTSQGRNLWLWRLVPGSLVAMSRTALPQGWSRFGWSGLGSLAVAGGWLWVGANDRLDRVSLQSGRVTGQTTVSRAGGGVEVAASPSGRVLLDSEGLAGGRLQLRDPQTGRLLAASPWLDSVIHPAIGGIIGHWAWIDVATGMMGYVQRVDLDHLTSLGPPGESAVVSPGHTPTVIFGTNGIEARIMDDVLWVTQAVGGADDNYCADPTTGQPRAFLHGADDAGYGLAASPTRLFFVTGVGPRDAPEIVSEPLDRACLTSSPSPRSAMPNPQLVHATFVCVGAQLRVSLAPPAVARRAHAAAVLVIRDTSDQSCALSGYPNLTFQHLGRVLPFAWGAGPYTSVRAPSIVTLAPGDRGYALLVKSACRKRPSITVDEINVAIPDTPGTLRLELGAPGGTTLDYCTAPRASEAVIPGDTLGVSPIESQLPVSRPARRP